MNGGHEGDRTLDLTDANRTLSQLSYAPEYEIFEGMQHICLPERSHLRLWGIELTQVDSQLSYTPVFNCLSIITQNAFL